MKPTSTKRFPTLLILVAIGISSLSCWKPQPRKTINEGDARPFLSIGKVEAFESSPPPTPVTGFPAFVWLNIGLKNDGNTAARITKLVAQTYLPSGDCDFGLLNNGIIYWGREISPRTEQPVVFVGKVQSPCKMALVLKITAVYTNLRSGVEYTQELPASPELSLEYLPVPQKHE